MRAPPRQRPALLPWRNVLENVLLPVEILGGKLLGDEGRGGEKNENQSEQQLLHGRKSTLRATRCFT